MRFTDCILRSIACKILTLSVTLAGVTLGELGQATCPAGYREVSAAECYKAAQTLFKKTAAASVISADAKLAPQSKMQKGNFTTVPDGCSISVRDVSSQQAWEHGWVVFFNEHTTGADPLQMSGCDSPKRSLSCDYSFKVCARSGGNHSIENTLNTHHMRDRKICLAKSVARSIFWQRLQGLQSPTNC